MARANTAVAKRQSTDISTIEQQLKALGQDSGKRAVQVARSNIRISEKSFILPDGTVVEDELNLVIVEYIAQHRYYSKPFDEDNYTPPDCFAINRFPNELAPSNNAPNPQAKSCAECPKNEFGSDARGRGKACSNSRFVAVLLPDQQENGPLMTIRVSPTAIGRFDTYINSLAGDHPLKVVTRFSFNPQAKYPSLMFESAGLNPNPQGGLSRHGETEAILNAEPDLSASVEAPKPTKARRK